MFNSAGARSRHLGAAVFVMALVLLTMLPLSGSLQSQGGLTGYTIDIYSPGNWYTGIILQDMDCDGEPEMLAGNRNNNSVEIWKYDEGLGTLSLINSITFVYHIHDLKAADFDHDGDHDVVAGLRGYGLYYATNTGSPCSVGNWSIQEIHSRYSWQVLVEDFDGDGELDILDTVDGGPIHLFYGDGSGSFAQGNSVFDPNTDMRQPAGFNAVDLNGDGLLDLIGLDAFYLRVFLNPGNRVSDWVSIGPTTPFGENDNAVRSGISPSAGDVDNDGYIDLAAFKIVWPSGPLEVILFKGGASGGNLVWNKLVLDTIDGEYAATHAGIDDLNGDGNLDIHIGGETFFNSLLVYLGDGQGGFTPAPLELDHGVGGSNSFVVRDLNDDGGPDIITTRATSTEAEYGGFEILWGPTPRIPLRMFMSTTSSGMTNDGVSFGSEDILQWNGGMWSLWFDGSTAGLMPSGRAKHNINALWIPDPNGRDAVFSFGQNARRVPGIVPKVDGMDLVWWDGASFSLYFDGSDVDLTNKTQEKIDAIHILPGSASPIGGACQAYLLISTQGPGKVRNPNGLSFRFGGEDVLGFCATNLGEDTAGFWHLVLDGSAEGMPRNSTVSLSASDDGQTLYLTTRAAFDVDSATGGHSMVYAYDFGTGAFSGPYFIAADEGLPGTVNGLHVEGDLQP